MKTKKWLLIVSVAFSLAVETGATTFYVDAGNVAPVAPFADWSTAATNIQDAIDAATNGDLVLVTNGVYLAGGKVMAGDLTNRVALDKAVAVQSVNGPWVTTIQGAGATNGPAAVRGAWLTNGAVLVGFTVRGGATRTSGDGVTLQDGGGVWCASSNALVVNCVIQSNTASSQGSGIFQGTVKNSLLTGNAGYSFSGAAMFTVMTSCTVVSNLTYGVIGGNHTNCICYFNKSFNFYSANSVSYCCTTPLPGGVGNITASPQFFNDGVHLMGASPCIGAGANLVTGTDIFGQPWANPPAMGCAERSLAPAVARPQIQLASSPVGFTVGNAAYIGQAPFSFSWLKDGVPLVDNGHFSATQTTNLVATGVVFSDAGSYQFVVSNASGAVTSAVTQLVIHTVDISGANPTAPYLTWDTAATNIQDAIAAAAAGEIVLVTNGLYASGGKSMDGVITNRVSVDKAILVQSVNGPNASVIQGAWDPTSTNGPAAVRCAWLTNSAILNGFTLQGGATRITTGSAIQSVNGGGVWGSITNVSRSSIATVANCVVVNNAGADLGGGAYGVALNGCTIARNMALGGGTTSGKGGGAEACNLKNCLVTSNVARSDGGGADNCNLVNCALTKNSSTFNGGGANAGSLVNCTVTSNTASGYSSGYGAAVFGARLTNCIVFGNLSRTSYPNTNYASCTMTYCCADPLAAGADNMNLNPQLLADGIHLAVTSSCLGAGSSNAVSGTDIDGQAWNNPPPIGCDEWQPVPAISGPPLYQANVPAHNFAFSVIVAGQSPFIFFWSKDGTPIQDNSHYSNSGTATLLVSHFGLDDVGTYQVVASNAFGAVTSQVAQVVMHAVDIASQNPVAPYSTWATAATNIQDAINSAAAGDIVLVTNGVYALGGKVMAGDLTNRVALDRAVAVSSVNGYATTIIQGAWDPTSTNGPGSVRCAYLADGAVLNGFTLKDGATRATGDIYTGGPLTSGGGVWCVSTNGIVFNCVLSNNSALYGGGISYGTLNNSLVSFNFASYGGGAYNAVLNNCTVQNNYAIPGGYYRGAGTYNGIIRNSIVVGNYYNDQLLGLIENNYYALSFPLVPQYYYSCTSPSYPSFQLPAGVGNLYVDPSLLGAYRLSLNSPCRGAGNPLYASGADLDGEPWAMPPSMGCDEGVPTNLVGPLSVKIQAYATNVLVNRIAFFTGIISGDGAWVEWAFGDGPINTNLAAAISHRWTNSGDYSLTFTAYNYDHPTGVSTNILIHVQPLIVPQLQAPVLLTNGFQFQFTGQLNVDYTVQYTTSLAPPVVWQTLQRIPYNYTALLQITDSSPTNGARFYRVLVQ